jgi:hypothetical protein
MDDEILKQLAEKPEPAKPRKKGQFDSGMEGVTSSQVSKATADTTRAGNYRRKTITLPPAQIDYIEELAADERLGKLAFYRWLIDQGLQAYEDGNRPEKTGSMTYDVKVSHPTSVV